MANTENAAYALLEEAERLGLRVDYEGFLVVQRDQPLRPRSDDEVQAERALVARLGECSPDIFNVALGKARAEGAGAFVGALVFAPSEQVTGILTSCDSNGGVIIAYPPHSAPENDKMLSAVFDGSEIFLVVDRDEQFDPTPSIASPWIGDQKFLDLLLSAEAAGLRLALDGGFLLLKRPNVQGIERPEVEAMVRRIGGRITEVRLHLLSLARATRGAKFLLSLAFIHELGFVTVTGIQAGGNIECLYWNPDLNAKLTARCNGQSALILAGGACEETASPPSAEQNSEPSLRSRLWRALGGG